MPSDLSNVVSNSFIDEYGTKFTARLRKGDEHVQLLITYKDGSEPVSYGFTRDDFSQFGQLLYETDVALDMLDTGTSRTTGNDNV